MPRDIKAQCRSTCNRHRAHASERTVRNKTRLHTKEVFELSYGAEVAQTQAEFEAASNTETGGGEELSNNGRVEFVPPGVRARAPDVEVDPREEVLVRFRGHDGKFTGARTWGDAQEGGGAPLPAAAPAIYLPPSFDLAPAGLRWVRQDTLRLQCATTSGKSQRKKRTKRPDVIEFEAKLRCVELGRSGKTDAEIGRELERPVAFVQMWREANPGLIARPYAMEHISVGAYRGLVYERGYACGLYERVLQSAAWEQAVAVSTRINKNNITDVSHRVVKQCKECDSSLRKYPDETRRNGAFHADLSPETQNGLYLA